MTKDKEEFSILRELWFPLLFGFILIVLMAGGYFLAATDTKKETVAKQAISKDLSKNVVLFLSDLKNGEQVDAYNSVSKEFKISMPYTKFAQFLADYPILTVYDKIEPGIVTVDGQTAVFPVVLHVGNTLFPVNFTLTQEDGEWKILGFIINQMTSGQDLKDLDAIKSLSEVANRFLQNIQKDNLKESYENETSEEFKKGTTLKMFVAYVNERPIFKTQTGIQVLDGHIDGGKGYLKMALKSESEAIPIDFTLKEEKEGWKIEGIYLLPPTNQGATKVKSGTVGTALEDDGTIKEAVTRVAIEEPEIHLSLLLEVTHPSPPLQVSMVNLETCKEISPISTFVPKEGEVRLSFSYTRPFGGFEPGNYAMVVVSGDEKKSTPLQ